MKRPWDRACFPAACAVLLSAVLAGAWEREKRGAKQRNMVVNVDAQSIGPVDVHDGPGEYTVNVTAPAGVWELTVQVIENAGPVQIEQATVRPEK